MRKILLTLLAVGFSCVLAWGAGAPDVKVKLVAHRIVKDPQGKENISSGDSAKPGEVIEYHATYKNSGTSPAGNLLGTLPVPAEMEYVADTALPDGASASLDGASYVRMPLTRKVKLANGTVVNREVPVSEYRSLRWNLKDLAPGASVTVSARMKIKDNQKGPVIIQLDSVKKSETKETGGKK
jgi:uncharacterized repeat protein (TIGR01451 family)